MPLSTIDNTGLSQSQILSAINMPTGSVVQVVQATTTSAVSTTSLSATNTNITASITPLFSTSKVLIMINTTYGVSRGTSNTYGDIYYQITRGGTVVAGPQRMALNFGVTTWADFDQQITINYLDSPATTSSTTYTLQMYQSIANTIAVPFASSQGIIQLLEIR